MMFHIDKSHIVQTVYLISVSGGKRVYTAGYYLDRDTAERVMMALIDQHIIEQSASGSYAEIFEIPIMGPSVLETPKERERNEPR